MHPLISFGVGRCAVKPIFRGVQMARGIYLFTTAHRSVIRSKPIKINKRLSDADEIYIIQFKF